MQRIFQRFVKTDRKERRVPFFRCKDHPKHNPVAKIRAVNHESVHNADPYAFSIAHKRLAWMFRISAGMNIGLFAILIVMVATIAELVPLKTTEIALVTYDPATSKLERINPIQQLRILPVTQDVDGFELIAESFVKRYSLLMLSIDEISQTDRMREAAKLTAPEFWKKFVKTRKKSIDEMITNGLRRSIDVETIELISNRRGVRRYAIEYTKTDEYNGEVPTRKNLRAYISIVSQIQTVHVSERYTNPTGFRVLHFSARTREIK